MKCPNCKKNTVKLVKRTPARNSAAIITGLLGLRPLSLGFSRQYIVCTNCGSRLGSFSK